MSTRTSIAMRTSALSIAVVLSACNATAPTTPAPPQVGGSVQAPPVAGTFPNQNITEFGRVATIDSVAAGQRPSTNVGGAAVGAVAGGILGNQVGGGRGRTLATIAGVAGGAVAGNAIANSNTSALEVGGVFRITIQLDQGGQRVIDVSDLGDLRQGDRVEVTNGQQISRLN